MDYIPNAPKKDFISSHHLKKIAHRLTHGVVSRNQENASSAVQLAAKFKDYQFAIAAQVFHQLTINYLQKIQR